MILKLLIWVKWAWKRVDVLSYFLSLGCCHLIILGSLKVVWKVRGALNEFCMCWLLVSTNRSHLFVPKWKVWTWMKRVLESECYLIVSCGLNLFCLRTSKVFKLGVLMSMRFTLIWHSFLINFDLIMRDLVL